MIIEHTTCIIVAAIIDIVFIIADNVAIYNVSVHFTIIQQFLLFYHSTAHAHVR